MGEEPSRQGGAVGRKARGGSSLGCGRGQGRVTESQEAGDEVRGGFPGGSAENTKLLELRTEAGTQ